MGEKEPFSPQIFLPVKVFFTGTSGKNVFTGKPGLPEQRFTTLAATRRVLRQAERLRGICQDGRRRRQLYPTI